MELRSFLEMCNVYRRFFHRFAKIAAPLRKTDAEYPTFEAVNRRLVSPPIFAVPRYGRKYTLDTDACGHQVFFALLQEQLEGGTRPIGYWSRAVTDAERNYTSTEN